MTVATPFAAIEASLCADTMRMLANAEATPQTGDPFPVIFDAAAIEAMGGAITAEGPAALALDAAAAGLVPHTSQLTIRGTGYRVIDTKPDGTGMTLLILEAA